MAKKHINDNLKLEASRLESEYVVRLTNIVLSKALKDAKE
jgi:hypothetical protein